ncbi:hypothetical protein ACIP2Y_01795 [Streptomyces sviceus]|uniref:hypothetical protein n=1 Tax=Streptomyces sviceus TaxID=285530 RepID=UPI0038123596
MRLPAEAAAARFCTPTGTATGADARCAGPCPDRPHAVTSGLDTVRLPGSHAYEAGLRVRGSSLHTRRTKPDARATKLNEAYSALHADAVRANRLAIMAVHNEIATVRDQLVTAEPYLAEEHRTQPDWHRNASEQARSYATLLNGTERQS